MSRLSNSEGCNGPPAAASCLIAGARSAVIQSRPAGRSVCSMRALVSTPRSPTITTRCSLKRCFNLSICADSVTGSAVLPSNTSTATGQPSAVHIRPMTICGRSPRWSRL
jgi:hypothetical protein